MSIQGRVERLEQRMEGGPDRFPYLEGSSKPPRWKTKREAERHAATIRRRLERGNGTDSDRVAELLRAELAEAEAALADFRATEDLERRLREVSSHHRIR